MAAKFVNVDRNTPMLLPPDLRDWVKDDDLVHFIIEAVDRLPLDVFHVNHRGTGSKQMPPHMMLTLVIYCYINRIFSSRKIEDATYRDVNVRYITGNHHPDHDTICAFRRKNFDAISEAFVDVLELAKELGILKLGNIALDGTHIKGNASIDQNVTYERALEIREQLKLDIAELMEEAERADLSDEDAERLPKEIARREKLSEKMDQAIEELKARAAKRQEIEEAKYREKVKKREEYEKKTGKKPSGRAPKKTGIEAIDERTGTPDSVSTDAGYVNADMIERVEEENDIEVYCSVHREDAHSERHYDYRPPKETERPAKPVKDPRLIKMGEKLKADEGKEIYSRRNHTVETAFGIIKEVMGFRGFLLRGIEKVSGEWELVCLSYNLKRLHNLLMKEKVA